MAVLTTRQRPLDRGVRTFDEETITRLLMTLDFTIFAKKTIG